MHTRFTSPRRGFTLIELLVVIAIIGILASIMFPVFSKAREKARQATCINNQKQIVTAVIMYGDDHKTYPTKNWASEINLRAPGILQCPSLGDDSKNSYGMNAYMHTTRPDSITRPSSIICTSDATIPSTLEGDFTRHDRKWTIVSCLDGHAEMVNKDNMRGLHFACGRFPLQPVTYGEDGTALDAPPMWTTEYASGTAVVNADYLIIGPYGDGTDQGCASVGDLLDYDYIGQKSFAMQNADAVPVVGDAAPKAAEIKPGTGADANGKLVKFWQKVASDGGTNIIQLRSEGNYNSEFHYRTTYAVTYVYSPETQPNVRLDFFADDGGKVWINGGRGDAAGSSNGTPAITVGVENNANTPSTKVVTIPKGISYIFVRNTNWQAGGMKFKLEFSGYTSPLSFSSMLN